MIVLPIYRSLMRCLFTNIMEKKIISLNEPSKNRKANYFFYTFFFSPLLMIPEYGPKEYIDGTTVMACLLLVNTLWSQLFFYLTISLFFWVPFLVLVVLYTVIAFRLMADPGIKVRCV